MVADVVLSGLLRKRQSIADELKATQGKLRQLVLDIDAIDATIRLFDPDSKVGIVRVRPIPRRHLAIRGESARLILSMLRDAEGPMTTRDIVFRVMQARGLNAADKAMLYTMHCRVGTSLRGLRERGTMESSQGKGASVRWWLAGAADAA
jgi:hypothetical protein